jgi:hypothetical protein
MAVNVNSVYPSLEGIGENSVMLAERHLAEDHLSQDIRIFDEIFPEISGCTRSSFANFSARRLQPGGPNFSRRASSAKLRNWSCSRVRKAFASTCLSSFVMALPPAKANEKQEDDATAEFQPIGTVHGNGL